MNAFGNHQNLLIIFRKYFNEKTCSNTGTSASPAMLSSVTKVVQPTATVSSVPVSGPSMHRKFQKRSGFNDIN